jgi:hypothetical protein
MKSPKMRRAGNFSTRKPDKKRQTLKQERTAWIIERRLFTAEEEADISGNRFITEGGDLIIAESGVSVYIVAE